jgi:hypothetical protein
LPNAPDRSSLLNKVIKPFHDWNARRLLLLLVLIHE